MVGMTASPHPEVDAGQVAEHLGISVRTLRRWTRAGRLPSHKASRKNLRYDLNEVEEALRGVAEGVDAQQVAEHLDISLRTVHRWIKAGKIPAHRVGPKLLRFDLAEVDEALGGAG